MARLSGSWPRLIAVSVNIIVAFLSDMPVRSYAAAREGVTMFSLPLERFGSGPSASSDNSDLLSSLLFTPLPSSLLLEDGRITPLEVEASHSSALFFLAHFFSVSFLHNAR